MAAATVLETLTFPRPSSTPLTASFSPIAGRRSSVKLTESRGLRRIQFSGSVNRTSSNLAVVRRVGCIVCEAQGTAALVPEVTDAAWQSAVLESDSPVLVEFWAPWCGPCRMIHPIIDELAKEYNGKLKCFKLNTDESPSVATRYGIRSIPTVIIFKGGEKKDAIIGAVPKTTLTTSIEKFL